METAELIILGFILFKAGAVVSILFMLWNMARKIGGVINASRLLTHVTIHTEDFERMYYLTHTQMNLLRNNGHEPDRADVVRTRPTEDHV